MAWYNKRVTVVLVSIFVPLFAVIFLFRTVCAVSFYGKLKNITAGGQPATFGELNELYSIPDGVENAADVIIESFDHFAEWPEKEKNKLPGFSHSKMPAPSEPLTSEDKALIASFVSDNRTAINMLHRAAKIEHSRYPVDLNEGFSVLLPHLGKIREGVKILRLESMLDAENDSAQEAMESVQTMIGVAESLHNEPMLISQLVNIACQSVAIKSLERAVNRTDFSNDQLKKIDKVLSDILCDGIKNAFIGERCCAADIYNMSASKRLEVLGGKGIIVVPMAISRAVGFEYMQGCKHMEIMNNYIDLFDLPEHERIAAAKRVEDEIEALSNLNYTLKAFMPALSKCVTLDLRHMAQIRTARMGIAAERFYLDKGYYPLSLDFLVPAYIDKVLFDPFDGKELRYKKLSCGFVVYSIGDDLRDNDGKPLDTNRTDQDWDVTFEVAM